MLIKMHERAARLNEIAVQYGQDWQLLSYVAIEFSRKVANVTDFNHTLLKDCENCSREGNQLSARLLHSQLGRAHRRAIKELTAYASPSTAAEP